jgi:hypothetical protein
VSAHADTLNRVTTPLTAAIDSLSDPRVSLANSLRRLLIVSRRIGSDTLTAFIRDELGGYKDRALVPPTRKPSGLTVSIRFDGFGGSYDTIRVGSGELPGNLGDVLEAVGFPEPVAELEALANAAGDSDPRIELPMMWVMLYREQIEKKTVPHHPMMTANQAYIVLPRTHLQGLLDRLRTEALDLALDLEGASIDAGSPAGPTVESEPELARVVNNFISVHAAENATVTVGDANVAAGSGATAVQLSVGDVSGLLRAVDGILGPDGVRELREALDEDGGEPAAHTNSFLDRVKEGGYVLASGITTNGAYDGLMAMLHQVFPGF